MRESVSVQTSYAVTPLYPLPNFALLNTSFDKSTPSLKKLMLANKSLLGIPSNFDLISSISRTIKERILIFLSVTSPSKSFSTTLGGGHWDFRFCGFGVHCCLRIFRFSAFGFGFRQNTNQFSNLVFDVVLVYPLWVPVALRSKRGQLCASTDLEYPQNLCVPLLHQID